MVDRSVALSEQLRAALAELSWDGDDQHVAESVWAGEGLGMLLWALELAQLPPYDRPFDADKLVATAMDEAILRPADEIERARETARLWHWRARTAVLEAEGEVDLPQEWQSFDQLVGATAMRGFEQGLLPAPMRGDFRAYGKVYRHLSPDQLEEALSIALERHHALAWACGLGESWDDVPLDT